MAKKKVVAEAAQAAAAEVNNTPSAEAETKETLRAELDELVAKFNESAEFSEFKVMKALEGKIAEALQKYTAACEGECFVALKKAENPMLEAAKVLGFQTLAVKDEKEKDAAGKETGKTIKVVRPVTKRIDPLRLHKTANEGIGADKLWYCKVERLNMLFTAATAIEINAVDTSGNKLDLKAIRDTTAMSDAARKITMKGEDNPSNDDIMLEDVQSVIDAMLGEGYKATPCMVKYLRSVHEKGGRASMSVVCSNERSMRQYMLDVCHAAITGDDFILDYKKSKKQA